MEATSRIFIKGLPPSLTVEDFRKHFSKQCPITDAKFLPQRRIGYVGYRTPQDAARAVKYHNRTFIRMSKIAVELARSVEEQQAARPWRNGTKPLSTTHYATRNRVDGESEDGIDHPNKRRRLGNMDDAGNAKLQEFLQTMERPSKSKIWENQELTAAHKLPAVESEVVTILPVDVKSDDQYSPIPKKQMEKQGEASRLKEQSVQEQVVPSTYLDQALDANEPKEDATQATDEGVPAATDDDWLRSKTSRLLGLVDDDDAATPIVPEGKLAATKPTGHPEGFVQDGDGNTSDDGGPTEKVAEEKQHKELTESTANPEETVNGSGRLFIRNLTYTSTERDIREHFESNGCRGIEEIHLPQNPQSGKNKGFAHVRFVDSKIAMKALTELDQRPFQGRLLHILPSTSKKPEFLDEFAISKLPIKQQQQIRRRAEAGQSTFNWNSMYMSSDAVISSISERLGVSKSELLDPTSSDAAVKQAHAETHIIQETKSYFMANGVDLDAFKKTPRGDTAVLVKNFPFGTTADDLRSLFDTFGPLKQLLMPPSGTIAIVEFEQKEHARSAFGSLAYRKFKGSILFLEKAPAGLFTAGITQDHADKGSDAGQAKASATELLGPSGPNSVNNSTLFVRNLNFSTNDERLRETFKSLDGFLSARVKTKSDPKKAGQTLSMGFGFLEFRSKQQAAAALAAMDGFRLDGHELLIRASHKAVDAAEERRSEDNAKKVAGRRTKIIIKNLPFEASKKDVRSLFGAYGHLRSVRVPKKFDSSTRGFAFADFVTAREAENAMDALRDTHLLGRRLILQFAAEETIDPEVEIEKMQQRVGRQADKVALQKLTGPGRSKFTVEGVDGLEEVDQL